MSAYRLTLPYERSPLQRRVSGVALAVGANLLLLLALLTLGRASPEAKKVGHALVVDLLPESHSPEAAPARSIAEPKALAQAQMKPPPIVLPAKPTIAVPPPAPASRSPLIEMSSADMAASDLGNLPMGSSGSDGDSRAVGTGPHGEVLYAAEWARHPTDAELSGYLPKNAPEGTGVIACKTIPGDRVDDCFEVANDPPGSHLASAVRQAAWQFRVRPPRVNGRALIGSWVQIEINYEHVDRSEGM